MNYPIYNTDGDVMFAAKIDCAEDAPRAQKLRLAVIWANRYVSLECADLEWARADLRGPQWVRPE